MSMINTTRHHRDEHSRREILRAAIDEALAIFRDEDV
jgi:hypothetical protein